MDNNTSFHFSPKIDEMLAQAGVVKELQALYSLFSRLESDRAFLRLYQESYQPTRKRARQDAQLIQGDFKEYYLRMQIIIVGQDKKVAEGTFGYV
jgi:hypothetical protein